METNKTKLQKIITGTESGISIAALSLLALFPFMQIILERFHIIVPAFKTLLPHLFLVLVFVAAMITTKSKEHISITIVQFIKNERIKQVIGFICIFISVVILTVLVWDSVCFIIHGGLTQDVVLIRNIAYIPYKIFAVVMPLAFAVMAFRFSLQRSNKTEKIIALSAILIGSIFALPAITKIIWGLDPPEPFYSWVNFLYDSAVVIKLPVVIFLIIAAFAGAPMFAVIGGISLVLLQGLGQEPERAFTEIYYAFIKGNDMIAIPLFTLTGFFLSESKAGERLVNTFKMFFSWLPGGLIFVTVIICAFFTSFTGASGVTILALGGILYTILAEKSKYPEKFSVGLLTSSGGIGAMFPPSLPIILAGSTIISTLFFMDRHIEYGILHFFLGALIPGLVLVLVMILFGITLSRKVKPEREKFELKKAAASLKTSSLEILLPFILLGGYFTGILNLIEVSAVSVIYVFIVEVFIHKDIKLSDVHKVILKTIPIIGGILAILAMARALSYSIIAYDIPSDFASWMSETIKSKVVFLLLLNLALLLIGCFMDIFSAILIILPLIIPIGCDVYGIDPVHLGIIFLVNLEVGFLTPPVGLNLFMASYRFGKPFISVCRYVLPFMLIQLTVVLLITFIPSLSTFLPKLFLN